MGNNDGKNEIKVKQVNPKLRLFLLIFSYWLWTFLLIFVVSRFKPLILEIPFFQKHMYLAWILLGLFFLLTFFNLYISIKIGVKYLPKDLQEYYLQKNNQDIQKIKSLEITNVTQLFNVKPMCQEIYSKDPKTSIKKFIELSWIEKSNNRLVVNGKINDLDFSWGIVTKMKKKNFKGLFLTILYFGPILGLVFILQIRILLNSVDLFKISKKEKRYTNYKKLGCFDLVAKNIGEINSENYLIFAAKFKKSIDSIILIPTNNQYDWPANLSEAQKQELQDLIKEMSYLPTIYINQDNISIIMKKYYYNSKDNNELQTWELLKQENSNNEIQFNYLNNAIKIYHIFNETI